jgi:choline dehydrogenase-like flavoprotein
MRSDAARITAGVARCPAVCRIEATDDAEQMTNDEFEYVIAGGGSARATLSGCLAAVPATSVCPFNAGGPDSSVLIDAPVGVVAMMPTLIAGYTIAPKIMIGEQAAQMLREDPREA